LSSPPGTTSSTSVDPCGAIAEICRREALAHVDAAYAGAAAIVLEMRPLLAGWEHADSIVVNPHKGCSRVRRVAPAAGRGFGTPSASSPIPALPKLAACTINEYGIQLGRRFRALKMWMQIRWFGVDGMAARLREHMRLARLLASASTPHPDWERLPGSVSTVCLRYRRATTRRCQRSIIGASPRASLPITKLGGRYTLRVALGTEADRGTSPGVGQALKEAARSARVTG
jgi:aromatic-L-amino-acid decarboxylase